MGQLDPAQLRLGVQNGREDLLPHGEAAAGMGDAGDGNALDADHRHQPAADVYEGAEGFQMGDGGGDDHAGAQPLHEGLLSLKLGPAPGENDAEIRLFSFHGLYCKADRLSDPGEDGNFPGGAFGNAQGGLVPGDPAGIGPQSDDEVVVGVAEEDAPFQNGAPVLCGQQAALGGAGGQVIRGGQASALGQIAVQHGSHSFLLSTRGERWRLIGHYMRWRRRN